MTTRDDLIPVVDRARAVVDGMGLRRHVVQVVTVTRSGTGLASIGLYDAEDVLELDPRPRVSWRTRTQAQSFGLAEQGDVTVSRISAAHTREQLDPGGDSLWRIDGEPFRVVSLIERNFGWTAILVRMGRPS